MKNNSRLLKTICKIAIIALFAIIGSTFSSCGDTDGGGTTETIEKAVYTSVDDEDNKYELTITPQSDKAAYEPKTGDAYTLEISYVDGTTKTSEGTVTSEVKNGNMTTATLSVSDISYTVTLITVTEEVRVFTEIKGTIPITDGNDDDPSTIEVELTLTPQVGYVNDAVIGVFFYIPDLVLHVGESVTLVPIILPNNAANKNVTWNSSNQTVAPVTNGLVTGMAAGNAIITVTTQDGGKTASCKVTVIDDVIVDIAVTGVTLNKASTSLLVGGSETLTATVMPANATNKSVTWSSSNNAIATISANGVVNAVAAGSATITVKTEDGDFTATCAITVNAPVSVTGITLNKVTTGLLIGGTETLYATVLPSNATNKAVTWSSSNTNIVTVTNGLITGIVAGTANITVTTADGNKTANCGVMVSATVVLPTGIRLNKTSIDLNVGDTETLIATVLPTNATDQNVRWESRNPAVTTVSESGIVSAVSAGESLILVFTSNGISAGCAVRVHSVPPTGVTLNNATLALKVGESETLIATVLPSNATNKAVDWDSNNKAVATVSDNGTVTAIAAGNATITVTTKEGKKTATCVVTVTDPHVPPTEVILNKTTLDLNVGATETLIATVLPADATNKTVEWKSSAPAVATVTNGLVTALSAGSATITVETVDGKKTATCDVKVTRPVTGVTLNKTTLDLNVGATETLIATVLPADATNKAVTWISSAPSVAKVENGLVTAVSVGSAIITVKTEDGGFTDTCTVTVLSRPPTGVSLNKTILEIEWSTSETLVATVLPTNATNKNVSWISSDNTIVTVSQSGVVTGADFGKATITVKTEEGGFNDTCDVTVYLTPAKLAAYLATLSANSASSPHLIKLRVRSTEEFTTIRSALNEALNKFVNLDLESTIASIPNIAFNTGASSWEGCTTLCGITIPNSVTSIGESAFRGSSSLASVTIPDSVTSVGQSAFEKCSKLANVTIGSGVASIENSTFRDCTSLASIIISDSVTSIGNFAFSGCSSLASVTIGNRVIRIGGWAFYECINIASIIIPNSVTSIEGFAFYFCRKLTSVNIPNSVTSIGQYAFGNCSSLTSVTIPNSITSIENHTFDGCEKLSSITIPDSVTSIGIQAFSFCLNFTSVTIPKSVTSIGNGVFGYCLNLTSINVDSGNNSFLSENGILYNKNKTTLIQYPAGKTGAFTIPDGVISIEVNAFWGCTSLTSITIPNSVTSIGNSAFSACISLISITIPNSVTSIGGTAFIDCTSLPSINIPSSVTSIGDYAFRNCLSLISVTLPVTITSFSTTAFWGDLYAKYHATNGGQGTYTTTAPVSTSSVWTKQ